jgi:hypothetical protein
MRSSRAAIVILVASSVAFVLRYTGPFNGRADWRVIVAYGLASVAVGQLALAALLALKQVVPIGAEHGPTALGQGVLGVLMLGVASLLWSSSSIPAFVGWPVAVTCSLLSAFGSPVARPPKAKPHES